MQRSSGMEGMGHLPSGRAEEGSNLDSRLSEAPMQGAQHALPRSHEAAQPAVAADSALVPVPASVFDDDFFRRPLDELRGARERPAFRDIAPSPYVKSEEANAWPEAKVPTFAGYAGEASPEGDELDIPAFLRRGQ